MATIDYPHDILPSPLVANTSHSENNRLLRTTMDSGYSVIRKRFTRINSIFNIQILLDQSSLSFFQAWLANTLNYGVNWFNMNIPVGDSIVSEHECRLLDNPRYTLNGTLWRVDMRLEAVEINLGIDYDSVMEGFIATIGGVRGFDTASRYINILDNQVNVLYPSSGYGPAA